MDALEAILGRRSVARLAAERPPRDAIARLLDAAVRAPCHHLTEPWRFIVLTDAALDELGAVMADRVRREGPEGPEVEARAALEQGRPRRAPVIVTFVYTPSTNAAAIECEDRYAVGAAMQNLLVAAHASGLAAYLRTGPAAYDPAVHRLLGLREGEEVAGFVYVGYPAAEPGPPTRRTPAAERTTWRGWD